jgi:tetratricopeptide (TPR) repeat protein
MTQDAEGAALACVELAERLLREDDAAQALDVLARAEAVLEVAKGLEVRRRRVEGEALLRTGNFSLAIEALQLAFAQAEATANGREATRVSVRLAEAFWEGGDGFKARATLQPLDALDALGPTTRARRDLLWGRLGVDDGALDVAVEALERSVESALEADRRDLAASAHSVLGLVMARRGHVTEGLERLSASVGFLQAGSRGQALWAAWLDLSDVAVRAGELHRALGAAQGGELLARRMGRPLLVARAAIARAWVHLEAGDPSGAEAILREHAVVVEVGDDRRTQAVFRSCWAMTQHRSGDRQAALVAHDRASLLWRDVGARVSSAFHEGMAAVLSADGMRLAHALGSLAQLQAPSALGDLLVEGASVGEAEVVLPRALELADEAGDPLLALRVREALGTRDDRKAAEPLVHDLLARAGPLERFVRRLPAVRWVRGAGGT